MPGHATRLVVLLVALLCTAAAALAQQQASPRPAIETLPATRWIPVQGQATDLAITPRGEVFARAPDSKVWRWQPETQRWSVVPGEFKHITLGAGGRPWGISTDGRIFRFNGLWWDVSGEDATDIVGNARGDMYALRGIGTLAKWNPAASRWEPTANTVARRLLAVGPTGTLWAITEDNTIASLEAGAWTTAPGRVRALAIGAAGTTYAVTEQGGLQRWNDTQRRWDELATPGITDIAGLALGPGDKPWLFTRSGAIFASDLFAAQTTTAATPSATARGPQTNEPARNARDARSQTGARQPGAPATQLTSDEPIQFVDTLETAARLAIGADGSIFALTSAGRLQRWSNALRRFEPFPGDLVKIAVAANGHPWGINGAGRIFRNDGSNWQQVSGTASDLALGLDGSLVISRADETLQRRIGNGSFQTIPGRGLVVALTPDGKPWTIRADGSIYRCDSDPCRRLPRSGKSLSIGPDGSIFVATPDNRLLRFDRTANDWREIPVPGFDAAYVAVGPRGRPWIITSTGKVLATTLFERDESRDQAQALGSTKPTTGTGDTTQVAGTTTGGGSFVFTKSFRTENFSAGCGQAMSVSVGLDGTVIVNCDNINLRVFNIKKETFSDYKPNPPYSSIGSAVTDADGNLWFTQYTGPNLLYRQKGSSYQSVTISGAGTLSNLSMSRDGSIYVADSNGVIWRKQASDNSFKRLTTVSGLSEMTVGGSTPWYIDSDNRIYEYESGKFVRRAASTSASHIGGGKDGSIWITELGTGLLMKWNATNKSFDKSNQTASAVAVDDDGRPWFLRQSESENLYKVK